MESRGYGSPPEASTGLVRFANRVALPFERFSRIEAASGLALLLAAIVAIAWANSPWASVYEAAWHLPIGVRLGHLHIEESVHFWINDGLMSVFFFVVGLEMRREISNGALSTLRGASMPIVAAIGGMAVPAISFLLIASDGAAERGWGVPMATDIAFALGVLALLGKRVPPRLRILLLAVAIIDDLGAILVIALFYSDNIKLDGLALAGVGIAATLLMQRLGARRSFVYLLPGALVWFGAFRAGVHPAIAGVIMGVLTPSRAWYGIEGFAGAVDTAVEAVRAAKTKGATDTKDMHAALDALEVARREALSPSDRLEHVLHPWVAFGVMPLFALANAGVAVRTDSLASALPLTVGIIVGLAVGKPLGIVGAAWLAMKLRIAKLPENVTFGGLVTVGAVAGIGFTMAIFIAQLAFREGALLDVAKLAVLAASTVAGIAALVIGRLALPLPPTPTPEGSDTNALPTDA